VIPGTMELLFNFRFSPASPVDRLKARVHDVLDRHRLEYDLQWSVSGQPFITPRGRLVEALSAAVQRTTGLTPALSTTGGISDGRFIVDVAKEVVEFGPVNESIHKIDEHMRLADIEPLSLVYERTIAALLVDG
jgi:succinyl-diaminopimelate desuccinylase